MSTYCSPPLAFLFNENEIPNAYDYQQWNKKEALIMHTIFMGVLCDA